MLDNSVISVLAQLSLGRSDYLNANLVKKLQFNKNA